jgi:hypothetical protein
MSNKSNPKKKGLFAALDEALGISKEKDNVVTNLTQVPRKDKGENATKFNVSVKNAVHQADLLFLPEDKGYRYALVVVDVATRSMDAHQLKSKKPEEVLKAFKIIYKRKYLSWPTSFLHVDPGSEFKGVVTQEFQKKGIIVRVGKAGRHRQQALVEKANSYIGRAIIKRQTAEELATGETAREWIDDLPKIVKVINDIMTITPQTKDIEKRVKNKKTGKIEKVTVEADPSPRCSGGSCQLLPVGTKVRVIAEKPMDPTNGKTLSGKFRAGDLRWEKTVRTVTQINLHPGNPPMYMISGIKNVSYTKNQLQVVSDNETTVQASAQKKFVVESIVKKEKRKGLIHYLVKWKDYPSSQNTWEPRTNVLNDVPTLVAAFENQLKANKKKINQKES